MITGRDRMLTAMTEGLRKNYPVVIPYLGIYFRDHWNEITDEPWWVQNRWDTNAMLEVEKTFQKKVDIDWVTTGACPPREWRKIHEVKTARGRFYLVDTVSNDMREISRPPAGGFVSNWPSLKEPMIRTREDVDAQVEIVQTEEIMESGRLDYTEAIVDEFGSEKFVLSSIGSPFWQTYHYFGFENTLLNLSKKPELMKYLLDRLEERNLEYLSAYARVGVDGVWVEECLTSADIMSAALYKRFVLPYVKRLMSKIRRLGMKSIYYPCGDVKDRLEFMIEAEPDCISLEESKKNFEIDIEWVNEVVSGRICIFGNLDSVWLLRSGTRSDLKKEIKRQIDVNRSHGKFVMSLGSPVTADTPLYRVKEYVDITRRLASL